MAVGTRQEGSNREQLRQWFEAHPMEWVTNKELKEMFPFLKNGTGVMSAASGMSGAVEIEKFSVPGVKGQQTKYRWNPKGKKREHLSLVEKQPKRSTPNTKSSKVVLGAMFRLVGMRVNADDNGLVLTLRDEAGSEFTVTEVQG